MADNDNRILVKELRSRGDEELVSLLESKIEDLHGANFKHAVGQLEHTHSLRQLRRDIARLRTVINERRGTAQTEKTGTEA